MYEKTVGSSVGPTKFDTICVVANFDTTREHDSGFCGFGLSIIVLTGVTRLVCLFVPHV